MSRARSMAMTMASGTRSTATNRTSGAAAAVWQVKRPLPHPSSIRSSLAPGSRERQFPRRAWGSEISHWAHRSIRGTRFFFLLIRIGFPPLMADANLRNPGEFRHFLAIIP